MEAGLDHLMSTFETDTGISADGVLVLDHDLRAWAMRETGSEVRGSARPFGAFMLPGMCGWSTNMSKYYELMDDRYHPGRWHLRSPVDEEGQA
ncbi:hypothetical protein [Cystobacter fuscus]|uniref:hypothetical protein n=1 Tax=Cystobacter fuscus TaxID=43 RepID=UPI0037C0E745